MNNNISFSGNPALRRWLLDHSMIYKFFAPNNFLPAQIINIFRTKPQQIAAQSILVNLYLGWISRKCVSFPRDEKKWSNSNGRPIYGYGWDCQLSVLDDLIQLGFICQVPGNNLIDRGNGKVGMQTRIWASTDLEDIFVDINRQALLQHLKEVFKSPIKEMPAPIILKDENKLPMDFKVRGPIRKTWDEVAEINFAFRMITETSRLDTTHDIPTYTQSLKQSPYTHHPFFTHNPISNNNPTNPTLRPPSIPPGDVCIIPELLRLPQYLYRVYNNGNWGHGGRFYGAYYQGWNEEQRSHILIDNEPIVELDYKSLHPTMCYALEGIQLDRDPYNAPGLRSSRRIAKVVLLCAINAENRMKAIQGAKADLETNAKNEPPNWLDNLLCGETFGEVYDALVEHNKPIAKYIGSGKGLELQNIDGNMAQEIMLHFIRQNEVCLCIHDSFIVRESLKQELYQVMRETYAKYNNGFDCGVD